jgi:hypothetical protein
LLIDCEEPSAVDRILEEVIVHGDDPTFREDLIALLELLSRARDPETEDKILQVLNSDNTPKTAVKMLESFLRDAATPRHNIERAGQWAAFDRAYAANKKYVAAAKLFDAGRKAEASSAVDKLLKEDPQYPFALMLRQLI